MAAHPKPQPEFVPVPVKAAQKNLRVVSRKSVTTHSSSREPIAAAKAKAHFLQLLDEVERNRKPITITKRGRVVAQLVPVQEKTEISAFDQVFGRMRGSVTITGDIVSPDWEAWGPEWR